MEKEDVRVKNESQRVQKGKKQKKRNMWGKDCHKKMTDYTCASESPFNSGEEILKI